MFSIHGKPQEQMDMWKVRVYGEEVSAPFYKKSRQKHKRPCGGDFYSLMSYFLFF